MKLNHECVRELMLLIEESLNYSVYIDTKVVEIKGFTTEEIVYTADKLLEAGYITANRHAYLGGDHIPQIDILSITWEGHKFLDTVRDNKVWKSTKSIISKFSSVSITMIENIASNVIVEIIKSQLS